MTFSASLSRIGFFAPMAVSLTLSSCAPRASWEAFVSPNYPKTPIPETTEDRIAVGKYTLVDDGDRRYRPEGVASQDYWETAQGGRIQDTNPEFKTYLQSIALDEPDLHGLGVREISRYVDEALPAFESFPLADSEESSWKAFQQIVDLAKRTGINTNDASPFITRTLALGKSASCWVEYHRARMVAGNVGTAAEMASIITRLNETKRCATANRMNPAPVIKDIVGIALTSAIDKILARGRENGDLNTMVTDLKAVTDKAIPLLNGAGAEIQKQLVERVSTGIRDYLKSITEDTGVTTALKTGSVDLALERFKSAAEAIAKLEIGIDFSKDLREGRLSAFRTALDAIASPQNTDTIANRKAKIDAIERRARELQLERELRADIAKARRTLSARH